MIRNSDFYVNELSFSTVEYGDKAKQNFAGQASKDCVESNCMYTGGGKLTCESVVPTEGHSCSLTTQMVITASLTILTSVRLPLSPVNFSSRQSFVNSDPQSAEYFQPDVDAWDFAGKINEAFGFTVEF